MEDVFLSLMAFERDGTSATLKVVVTPLVVWLWIGAYVMALGTVVAVWPGRGGSALESSPDVRRQPFRGRRAGDLARMEVRT